MNVKELRDIPPWEWPQDAPETILETLRNRFAELEDRIDAAQMAGDATIVDDELADALLSVLTDDSEDENLRAMAAIALGPGLETADMMGLDDEDCPFSEEMFGRILDTLESIVKDESKPKLLRRRALEGGVRAQDEWQADIVSDAYAGDDPEWHLTAVFCMQYVPGFDEQILEVLRGDDPAEIYCAVTAAGNFEIREAWSHIRAILEHGAHSEDEKWLLIEAIEAAPLVNNDRYLEYVEPYVSDEDEDIAEAAEEALAMGEAYANMPSDEDDEDYEDYEDDENYDGDYEEGDLDDEGEEED